MKKLWLLLLLVLPLGGCIDDMEFNLNDLGSIFGYPEQEEGLFVFYPLFNHSSSNSPLKLHVAPRTDKDWDANQTGEIEQGFDNMHVIALYQKECPNCEKQAPYMARLADKFSQQTSLNFSVIFADVYNTDIKDREARQKNNENREEVQQRDWVQELNKSARVYTSYYRYCPDSNSFQQKIYCYRMLNDYAEPIRNIPYIIFIVKESNDTLRFIPDKSQRLWQSAQTEEELEEAYAQLEQHTQDFWDTYKDLYPKK